MTDHPCKGRSKVQITAFEAIATGQEPPPRQRTINALLNSGLIELAGMRKIGEDRFGAIELPEYQVPIPIHIQWCRWAAETIDLMNKEAV